MQMEQCCLNAQPQSIVNPLKIAVKWKVTSYKQANAFTIIKPAYIYNVAAGVPVLRTSEDLYNTHWTEPEKKKKKKS